MTDEKMNEAVALALFSQTFDAFEMKFNGEAHAAWFRAMSPERQQGVKRRLFLDSLPNYLSPDWSGVKAVVERMQDLGFKFKISEFMAQFYNDEVFETATAESIPRAVCSAALMALGFALRDGEWVKGE